MCVPDIFIRDDGKGFVVRKGGIDFNVKEQLRGDAWMAISQEPGLNDQYAYSLGDTIMEAVDSALAKVRAAEKSTQVDNP